MIKPFTALGAVVLIVGCHIANQKAEAKDGDAARGEVIALDKCSGCHEIFDRQSRTDTFWYPSFTKLANRPDADYYWIASKLRMSHRYMPDHNLNEPEVADVTIYIMERGFLDISP